MKIYTAGAAGRLRLTLGTSLVAALALPGCVTQGETLRELRVNIKEAIAGWLAVDYQPQESHASDQVIEVAI